MQLAERLGVSRKTVATRLKKMKELGLIERIGYDRKGYWKLSQLGTLRSKLVCFKKTQSAPVFRVYNPNDGNHHYTMNKQEKDFLVSLGWQDEGLAFRTAPIEK